MKTPKKILIVDDQPQNVTLIERIVASPGTEILKAFNGNEAVNIVKTSLPDIVLLDVNMPDMDGYEVCRRIKSCKETNCIPVIMISALNDEAVRNKSLDAGARHFLSKPFDPAELSEKVRKILTA